MAYTEKVSLSGTALSFLIYECANSKNGQEGFLIGDVSSEITNHISDSQSDNARLDTEIVIRTVLPLPAVSQFYFPTGRIKEDIVSELLSDSASEVIGWYKYRRNNTIKPTLRDKLISRGLQRYFERHHGKKNFVTCSITNKVSGSGSTHSFTYRFGKINCLDMYEYIEDVTANLGEKLTGYKKAHRQSPYGVFNKIIKESNVQNDNTSDAILAIQKAVDERLLKEARIAVKTESAIKELEAEIEQMTSIMSDKHIENLRKASERYIQESLINREAELVKACVESLQHPSEEINIFTNHSEESSTLPEVERESSPIICTKNVPRRIEASTSGAGDNVLNKNMKNYAAALRKSLEPCAAVSSSNNNAVCDDLIDLNSDLEKNSEVNCIGDSSPEY